ncbi:ATP-dependent helicase HrpB [bacterium]|nr:ATP-dependent helicase HrpB [bacterium]
MTKLLPLPIDPIVPDIVVALQTRRAAVVVAPPGAGKTTRIPPALLGAVHAPHDQVLVLQPRRVAARAAAARIADERGWRVGEEVGWQVRFENRCGPRTRLRVLTEGILTRRLQDDQLLEGVGCVVLDEFHERSIYTDLAIAMLREIQQALRPDLMLLVMSATMDPRPVSDFLGNAPVIESPGRLYPVEVDFLERASRAPAWEDAAAVARRAVESEEAGHVLVFLPGIGEIRRAESLVRDLPAELHVLHSSISGADQDRALRPTAKRKLILATNIAETSLTIDGVRTVIDTGLARVPVSDPRLGIDRLELRRISRASADQRAGRAGRTAPGRCFRLWTREEDAALAPGDAPEIKRVDLASTVLALKTYGVSDPARFGWFEAPRPDALALAERLLRMLGAIAPDGRLTEIGRRMSRMPVHPRIGRMLLAGADHGLLHEAAMLAAILSERDVLAAPALARRRSAGYEGRSDLIERLERVEAGDAGIDPQAAANVRRVADELIEDIRRTATRPHHKRTQDSGLRTQDSLRQLPLFGWPDRVTVRRASDPSRGVMVGGRGIVLEPSSVVRRAPIFLSIDPRDPENTRPGAPSESRVSLAGAIEPQWLEESFPHLIERRVKYQYDPERGRVMGLRQTLFAELMIDEEPVGAKANADSSAALCEYLQSHRNAVLDEPTIKRWLARLNLLNRHMPELNLPEIDEIFGEILNEACDGQTSMSGALGHVVQILENRLNGKQRRALSEHAPDTVALPSGRRARLEYQADGPPVLAVKLQELFGLAQGPRVAGGRVPVLLHLLAPNGRPAQITSDLASFWNSGYAEVRKDLRARYPRHPWPEDPWKKR